LSVIKVKLCDLPVKYVANPGYGESKEKERCWRWRDCL